MRSFALFVVLWQSAAIYAHVELSDLPTQESIQNVMASVEDHPTQYLPQYTKNPPQTKLMDNPELLAMPNLNTNEVAQIVEGTYRDKQATVAQLKEQACFGQNDLEIQNLSQSLAVKYQDWEYRAQAENVQENDFKQVANNLAVVSEASHNLNEQEYTIFQGHAHQCRKYGFGYLNCCGNSGWGQFVSECSQEEIALRQARENGTAIFLGTKKSGSKLKQKKYDVYCVFESKLARLLQEQGRFFQLQINFGDAKSPNCRAISATELSQINLDSINLNELYPAITNRLKPWDENQLSSQIGQGIIGIESKIKADG